MNRRRWIKTIAVTAAGLLVLAACGDDDDDSGASGATTASAGAAATTSGGGASGGGDVRGVTATSIKVGGLGQLNYFPGLDEGAKARFARANKEGGVNGRMIDYVGLKDDNADASANLDLARAFVEQEKVFALVTATSTVLLPATTDYLNEQKVPFIGWGFSAGYCQPDSYGFGFNGCLAGASFGVKEPVLNEALMEPTAKVLKNEQYTVAILNGDDDAGHSAGLQFQQLYGDARVKRNDYVPTSGVTDYSPYINPILASGADSALLGCDFACIVAVKAGLRDGGFKGPAFDYATYLPGGLTDPGLTASLEGGYTNVQFPPQEAGGQAIEQFLADLQAVGEKPAIDVGVSVGYWSADVFLQMVAAAGADLTPESFQAAAAKFTYKETPGGLGALAFPKGWSQPSPCAALVKLEKGAYKVEVPFTCYGVRPAPK